CAPSRGLDSAEKARRDLMHYAKIRSAILAALRQASCKGEDVEPMCFACLWCAFNHPQGSDVLRRGVSEALRRTGKAHITMACDAREVVAVVLSDKFVEMAEHMASAPVGVWVAKRKPDTTPMH